VAERIPIRGIISQSFSLFSREAKNFGGIFSWGILTYPPITLPYFLPEFSQGKGLGSNSCDGSFACIP